MSQNSRMLANFSGPWGTYARPAEAPRRATAALPLHGPCLARNFCLTAGLVTAKVSGSQHK